MHLIMNRAFMSNNTSGIIGVYWSKANEKWRAVIGFNGKENTSWIF